MTVQEYIINNFANLVSEDMASAICVKRRIPPTEDVDGILNNKGQYPIGIDELLLADTMYAYLRSFNTSSNTETVGNATISCGGLTISPYSKKQLKAMADEIYTRYGEKVYKCPIAL